MKNDVRRRWLLRRDSARASGALFFDFGHFLVEVLVWDRLQLRFWVFAALLISTSSSVAGLSHRFYHNSGRGVLFLLQAHRFFPFLARAATFGAVGRFLSFSAESTTVSVNKPFSGEESDLARRPLIWTYPCSWLLLGSETGAKVGFILLTPELVILTRVGLMALAFGWLELAAKELTAYFLALAAALADFLVSFSFGMLLICLKNLFQFAETIF